MLGLSDILRCMPENSWIWSVLFFDGIGEGPNGMYMADFDEAVEVSPKGYIFDWTELVAFAGNLHQVIECAIIAVRTYEEIVDSDNNDDIPGLLVRVNAFDSTEWLVEINESIVASSAIMECLASLR